MCLRRYLINLVDKSKSDNDKNILDLLEKVPQAKLLDLGCADGEWTLKLGEKVCTKNLFGVDIIEEQIKKAISREVECRCADLNGDLPFEDEMFDVVHANQVIEHIYNLEKFIKEAYRVLKTDGYAIISTENLSSWHNIFALICGWQPFSATNYLLKTLGNPLSLWKGREHHTDESLCHNKLWAYRGLIEFLENYNFKIERIKGAGYYPLFSFLGNLDKRHCHWITIKARKKSKNYVSK